MPYIPQQTAPPIGTKRESSPEAIEAMRLEDEDRRQQPHPLKAERISLQRYDVDPMQIFESLFAKKPTQDNIGNVVYPRT